VDDALPVCEIEFDGHVTHELAPSADEYDPAGHVSQLEAPVLDDVPAGHC
jgi:hypothetical protein